MLLRPARRIALLLAAAAGCAATAAAGPLAASAAAGLGWKPCSGNGIYACGHLTVPLDRSGKLPGTITLAVRRRRAPVGDESVAVFALAGGPGQAAIPLADGLASVLGSVLASRDLIVFDQRGTGLSGALRCPAFVHHRVGQNPPGSLVAACARQLGSRRGHYTTEDSVQDIEALRQATGYRKIVLYGTSYGTKVALDYAREYPDHVAALLLDSTVTPDGPDVFSRSTIGAVGRVLGQLCASARCAHITEAPQRDLAALAARLRTRHSQAPVIDGHGVAHRVTVSEHDLLDILVAGDLEPTLRADFPGAVGSALAGDSAPLARLRQRALASEGSTGVDNELFYSTYCEEVAFPWNRAADPGTRLRELEGATAALPAGLFAPFDRNVVLFESGGIQCAGWPYGTDAVPAGGVPLPNVPTLILSGADDLRTPTEDARSVAAQIPDAKLVVVPFTGHSVLGSDPGKCAEHAVQAFFSNRQVKPCSGGHMPALDRPTPVAPLHLDRLRPYHGVGGRAGRTVTAVSLTLDDLLRQVFDKLNDVTSLSQLSNLRVGGLRAGWARFSLTSLTMHGLVYVPGVVLSGSLGANRDVLRIGGGAAVHGVLTSTGGGPLHGTLGGQQITLSAPAPSSAIGAMARAASASQPAVPPRIP